MNQGIAAATGDVVGLLNSDDFYTSDDILATIAECFSVHPDIDGLYGDVHYVDEHDLKKTVRYYNSRMFRRWWMRMGFMPAHPSFYCKKAVYERYKLNAEGIEGFKGKKDCAYFNTDDAHGRCVVVGCVVAPADQPRPPQGVQGKRGV